MKTTTNWLDARGKAKLKKELITLLRTLPREYWTAAIMTHADDPARRVAVFQIFCAMEQSGELDELKARPR